MIKEPPSNANPHGSRPALLALAALLAIFIPAAQLRADEPYARSRDYDLQHSKIALRFDLDQKRVLGEVTHSLSILRGGSTKVFFDSVGLTIQSVTLNRAAIKFETSADKLIVPLPAAAKAGDKFEIVIRYEGKPAKGMYFILPDKDYPERPRQIWTQGESEDTRYYLPTYDYPNDRLTTETVLTVPASWITVSNGKLMNVSEAGKGLKTWHWKDSVPSSTYLITVVAGEFDEITDTWHGIPVTYYAPKGRGDRLPLNYGRTPAMMELFSKKFGVDYPWEKYAQVMVDDFVAGGMENSSATTNNSNSLVHPKLAPEYFTGEDDLISHELGHQWFGDLVTCKDWGNVWLNEGFATYYDALYDGHKNGRDALLYDMYQSAKGIVSQLNQTNAVVRRNYNTPEDQFGFTAYPKGSWLLHMLRHQLGEELYRRCIKTYLERHKFQNVITEDLNRVIEELSGRSFDQFFDQWAYHAGQPEVAVNYSWDEKS